MAAELSSVWCGACSLACTASSALLGLCHHQAVKGGDGACFGALHCGRARSVQVWHSHGKCRHHLAQQRDIQAKQSHPLICDPAVVQQPNSELTVRKWLQLRIRDGKKLKQGYRRNAILSMAYKGLLYILMALKEYS